MSMLGRYFFPSQLVKDAFKGQRTCEWHDTVKCNVRKHVAVMGLQWAGSAYLFDDNCYGLKKKKTAYCCSYISDGKLYVEEQEFTQ